MSEKYEKALERALEKIPKKVVSGERFEEPRPEILVFGRSKTMISNFADLSRRLNRDPNHILKFLSKEMATAGTFDGQRVYFQGKFPQDSIVQLLHIYITKFVVCPVCNRPDTKIEKSSRVITLTCEACGAKSPIRPI